MSSTSRSLGDIESALDRNRESMGGTLDALQNKLSAENLFDRGFAYVRESGANEFLVNFKHSVQRNPLPISLLGAGVVWLMVNGSDSARGAISDHTPDIDGRGMRDMATQAGHRTGAAATSTRDGLGQAATSARDGLGQAATSTRDGFGQAAASGRDGVHKLTDSTRRGAARLGDASRRGAEHTADGVSYMLNEQPLITAALGLAIGAVVAASLPRTRREDDMMGDTRDDFVDYAREAGEEKVEQVRSVADSALDAAGEAAHSEADRQGLSSTDSDSTAQADHRADNKAATDDTAASRPGSTPEF